MISLKWFKDVFRTEKEQELEKLKVEEQQLKNEILKRDLQLFEDPLEPLPYKRPFKTVTVSYTHLTLPTKRIV